MNIDLISSKNMIDAECIKVEETMSVIEKSLLSYKSGEIILPKKTTQIFDDKTQNRINCMPSTLLKEKVCGVKWVSVFPQNPIKYNLPNVSGIIILSEITKGYPFAVMDGTLITAMRTACMGAIGAKYLARDNSSVYGTIGTGTQAKMHFRCIKTIFPDIKTCYVASKSEKEETDYELEMKKEFPDVNFIKCNSRFELASENADIIVTAVSCQKPLLKADYIKEGAFYCHVGGWEDEYDVPKKADKIICDDWESLKHRGSPTIARMYQEGLLKDDDIYCNIGDIVDGTYPGRNNESEFIYFNSIGLSFVDIAVAYHYYSKVTNKNIEKKWDMFIGE